MYAGWGGMFQVPRADYASCMLIKAEGDRYQGARFITTEPALEGDVLHRITGGLVRKRPTYQTVQIGVDAHLEDPAVLVWVNHSCQPSVIVDTTNMVIVALRDMSPGDELTYFYPSTEWNMARTFACQCGALQCIRLIAGARYLSIDTLCRYFINQHIRDLIAGALAEASAR